MKNKCSRNRRIIGFVFLIIFFSLFNIANSKTTEIRSEIIPSPKIHTLSTITIQHDPIFIDGNTELATFIKDEGLSGEGTVGSPYIIENFAINASTAHGIYINNTNAYLTIQNCVIESGNTIYYTGVFLRNTTRLNFTNNILTDNFYGFLLYESNENTLFKNNVSNNQHGITLEQSSDNTIIENNINNGVYGIHLYQRSDNNIISENNAFNTQDGIVLSQSSRCTLSGNNLNNNKYGIHLFDSDNNTLSTNNVNKNYPFGVLLSGSRYNTLFGNNISYNNEGLWFVYSSNNTIYFNDIYENRGYQALEKYSSEGNRWDNGSRGNYWGNDYTDRYPNAKRTRTIWKTPYEINGSCSGIDNFPLVNPINFSKYINGFPLVSILFFVSVGVFLLRRRIKN